MSDPFPPPPNHALETPHREASRRFPALPAIDLASLFEARVQRAATRTALTFEDVSLPYEEVNRRANRLAHLLQARGVGPEVVVGVCLERSLEMVLAMLAVHKAGGVCLPLEPSHPTALLTQMMEDAAAAMVITETACAPRLGVTAPPLVMMTDVSSSVAALPAHDPARALSSGSGAQIMFTSGSTGRPKGVTLTHGGLTGFLNGMCVAPGLTADDVVLAISSTGFDSSMVELYQTLICGGHAVVIPQAVARDGTALWERVRTLRPTVLNGTPATFHMLIEAGWTPETRISKVICGGETMTPRLAALLLERTPALWNVYGPTETTALCTLHRVLHVEDPIPVGKPLPGVRIRIVDENLHPTAIGQPGEILIGGNGVSRGYLRRETLTQERFMVDPFDDDPSARLYRSGDRGMWRADGNIVLLGRLDDQVKINGCRIEPQAVESVLEQHTAVRQAVVGVRDDRLVAYVVADEDVTDDELTAHVVTALPAYMAPTAYARPKTLPLSASAKVDRRALLALPFPASASAGEGPRTPLEAQLVAVFRRVLGREATSVSEPFTSMALDSLRSVRLLRALEEALGRPVPIPVMLRARNIADLAAALSC